MNIAIARAFEHNAGQRHRERPTPPAPACCLACCLACDPNFQPRAISGSFSHIHTNIAPRYKRISLPYLSQEARHQHHHVGLRCSELERSSSVISRTSSARGKQEVDALTGEDRDLGVVCDWLYKNCAGWNHDRSFLSMKTHRVTGQ